MKSFLTKELAVWLMPTNSGVVRKITLTPLGVLIIAGVVSAAGYIGFQAFNEYRQFQVQRLYHASIEDAFVTHREQAAKELKIAKRQLSSVATDRDSLREHTKKMQAQMDELNSVIGGLRDFVGLPLKSSKNSKGGIGGAEIPVVAGGAGFMAMYSPTRAREWRRGAAIPKMTDMVADLKYLPIAAPISGNITSRFGPRRSPFHFGLSRHQGLDISARYGAAIYAPADGVVSRVVRHPTYGLMIDLDHSTGLTTRYAHLSKAVVVEGQRIIRGTKIGAVGTSGRSTGPHLHYEVRYNSQAIDPERFLQVGQRLTQLASSK
jgi:murein DD-endopeptidase MepM/ murein hydrolase activator NlpD